MARAPRRRWWPLILAFQAGCTGAIDSPPGDASLADSIGNADGATLLGDVTIRSAAEVEHLRGVRRITGDLVITMQDDVSIAFPELRAIEGSLLALGDEQRKVSGRLELPALETLGGNLELDWTAATAEISAPLLTDVGGHVRLTHGVWHVALPSLTSINGELRFTDGNLHALDVSALAHIEGSLVLARVAWLAPGSPPFALPALESIGDSLDVQDCSEIALSMKELVSIAGDVELSDMALWIDLPALERIGDDLRIASLALHAADLRALASVAGDLSIDNSSALPAELAFPALASVAGGLVLRRLGSVERILMPNLTTIGRVLAVSDNATLARLDLARLAATTSDVMIASNGPLALDASALARVGGDLLITDNARLQLGLGKLVEVVGTLRVAGGTVVAIDLAALAKVGRDLDLIGFSSEVDEIALGALITVNGSLRINDTHYLDRFDCERLPVIGDFANAELHGDLEVRGNSDLAAISFPALAAVRKSIVVRDNRVLDDATAARELDDVVVGDQRAVCDNGGAESCP